ncbi:MAG: TonB-dependent receptor [Pseudomonadota bacterium]
MKKHRNHPLPLATAIAMALGGTSATTVFAQDDEDNDQQPTNIIQDDQLEEVVVTGIRGSLVSSRNLKRDSQGIVDGIVAEDIGKFPDTNLAESMQRIAGVSIDRSAIGEGQRVTVRGVGPDFNLVTLNGRQMPASRIEDTGASSSRAFDFANLASEAISAVEIKKTSRADLPTGGIGATVNIKTTRPLDARRTIANIGLKGVYDESTSDGDSITPEISGIFSTLNEAETFGVALTASYQDRNLGFNQAAVANGWRPFAGDEANWGTIPFEGTPGSENITNRPAATDIYSVPQNLVYSFNEVQRERTNGQLTFQFRPIDEFTATLDYTYAENQLATQRSELSAWFNFGPSVSSWTDGPVASPLVYSETINPATADICSGAADFATVNELGSVGLNLEWDATDNLVLSFDYHDSDSESGADSPLGSNSVIGACAFARGTTTADFSGDFPILSVDLPPGQTTLDASQFLQTGRSFRNSFMRSEVEQANLSGKFYFADESSLDFGVLATEVNNRSAFSNVQTDSWGGFGTPADYPDAVWGQLRSVAGAFDNMPGIGGASSIFPNYFDWDFDAVRQAGIAVAGGDPSSFLATDNFNTDRRTNEDSLAAFLQYNTSFQIGDMPANLSVGVRYEETDIVSSALVPTATGILWVAPNEFSVQFTDPAFTTLDGSYDYVLPNLDFNVSPRDDMVVRASYSETIGRPGWGDIQGGQTISQLIRIDGGTGNQGDPGLLPLESENIDLSFEWYYNEESYVSVSYFRKDIDNYVGITTIQDTPFDLPHPGQGARFAEAVAAVGTDLQDVRNYIFENYGDTPEVNQTGVDANGNAIGTIAGIPGEDPATVFNIVVPSNQQAAEIDGWELSVQHMFGETGFGAQANFTVVDSNIGYDNADRGDQFAIEGLSDSANLVAFYETDKWGARLAWNWRDEFLSGRFDPSGLPNPVYTDAYDQFDLNINYNVNDNLTLFLEGINVTDEIQRLRGRADNQTLFVTQTGARYMIGGRYNF